MIYALVLLPLAAAWTVGNVDSQILFNEDRIAELNSMNLPWKASSDQGVFFKGMTRGQFKGLLGTIKTPPSTDKVLETHPEISTVADAFDARTNWPDCVTIRQVRDQSACGSCWAFGAVEAISDRYCTYLGSTDAKYKNVSVSADEMTACCRQCGNGCEGGYPAVALEYWVNHGLSTEECDPYPLPKCEHHIPQNHYPPCPSQIYPTPKCQTTCKDGSKKQELKGQKTVTVQGADGLQKEIQANGPVEVAFTVYADFETYKSGVYIKTSDQELGGHAVRMLGWGVTTDTPPVPYWICANSWNEDWGENGYFRIIRGKNECGIEDEGWGGVPAPF